MTIPDIIRSGQPCQIELLREFPETIDPSQWIRLPWISAPFLEAIPQVLLDDGGMIATLAVRVTGKLSDSVNCAAFGVRHQNLGIFVGVVSSIALPIDVDLDFQANVQINYWIN